MNHSLCAVRFGDKRRVYLQRGDVRLRASRRQDHPRVLHLVRRSERRQLSHIRPHRDLDAVDATLGDIENDPGAVFALDLHGA